MTRRIVVFGGLDYAQAFLRWGNVVPMYSSSFVLGEKDVDLVVFTGGEDVDPSLYGEQNTHSSINPARDASEKKAYDLCIRESIPMVGICRGMQFLNVMNGGKMIQHVEGHAGRPHLIHTIDKRTIPVNSTHHQASVLNHSVGQLLAWADFPLKTSLTEAMWYPKTKCLGVQWHPEQLNTITPGFKFFAELVDKFIFV